MDHNELMDKIAKYEALLSKFAEELLDKRLDDKDVSESITTHALIAQSSLYICRIAFERVCKKLNATEEAPVVQDVPAVESVTDQSPQ